eukprot:111430-Pyramimonas_sp.AAC.1
MEPHVFVIAPEMSSSLWHRSICLKVATSLVSRRARSSLVRRRPGQGPVSYTHLRAHETGAYL